MRVESEDRFGSCLCSRGLDAWSVSYETPEGQIHLLFLRGAACYRVAAFVRNARVKLYFLLSVISFEVEAQLGKCIFCLEWSMFHVKPRSDLCVYDGEVEFAQELSFRKFPECVTWNAFGYWVSGWNEIAFGKAVFGCASYISRASDFISQRKMIWNQISIFGSVCVSRETVVSLSSDILTSCVVSPETVFHVKLRCSRMSVCVLKENYKAAWAYDSWYLYHLWICLMQ